MKKIVCVTSCPMGIAHTYMAQEMLQVTGKKMGIDVIVETHGAMGIDHMLTNKEIKESDAVIIASDQTINLSRFDQKPLLIIPIKMAIKEAENILKDAIDGKFEIYHKG